MSRKSTITDVAKLANVSKSTVSYVGNTMLADIHSPSITSIDVSGYELGFSATSLLIDVIKKKTISSCSRIIPTEIVERDST